MEGTLLIGRARVLPIASYHRFLFSIKLNNCVDFSVG